MDLQGGIKLGPSLWKLVELNWTVTQFMQSLDGTWTELQFQVSQELELWTKFFWKGTDTTLVVGIALAEDSQIVQKIVLALFHSPGILILQADIW